MLYVTYWSFVAGVFLKFGGKITYNNNILMSKAKGLYSKEKICRN